MAPSNTPNATSQCWARFTAGVRNSGTALAIASTPVSEEHPAEKALRITTTPSASVAWTGQILTDHGHRMRTEKADEMIAKIPMMNTSVGPISTLADSAMPTKLMAVAGQAAMRHASK